MQYKTLLLASFVEKDYLQKFLHNLNDNYRVRKDRVFVFDLNEDTHLLTYKIKIDLGVRFDIKKELHKTIQIHKKKQTFFTINALNRLIERDSGLGAGNVNHKEHQIDWDKYDNKLILLRGDKLEISDISRVFLSDS
tara:strand:- start:366 stop:776 length:411 start_codon:yes stop_codon:yes gene_type:complete